MTRIPIPPTEEPETPPAEEPMTPEKPTVPTPEPLAPLPEGTVVFVAPRPLTSPAVGQQLKVSLNIKGAAGVSGYDVTVGFDPTALRYVESANADYLPAGAFVAPAQVTANSVYLSAISLAGVAPTAEGTLATLTFQGHLSESLNACAKSSRAFRCQCPSIAIYGSRWTDQCPLAIL